MLAIDVEYLLGRAVATDVSRRDEVEWPPHPTRLFSALVDALGDVKLELENQHTQCANALRWLEEQDPPEIGASLDEQVSHRQNAKYFVPVNDETVDAKKMRSAPLVDQRTRQERYFPAVVPAHPIVSFVWRTAEPSEEHSAALDLLLARVPYLGHSSSLVRAARNQRPTNEEETGVTWLAPTSNWSGLLLRVPSRGRLARLETVFERRQASTLVQPPKGREVSYVLKREVSGLVGPHGPMLVVSFEGGRFGLEETASVTSRYRAALMKLLGDDAPETLTGHASRGVPAARSHIAFAPLANIDHEHADGAIKGLAVIVPRDLPEVDRLRLDQAMGQLRVLHFGGRGEVVIRPMGHWASLASLNTRNYARPSRTWVSVTPVALSQHPKRGKRTEEEIVQREFDYLGLPVPHVRVERGPFLDGTPAVQQMSKQGITALENRVLRHVLVQFEEPVRGPLLLGAGRYMGFGLLRPLDDSRVIDR